MAFMIENSDKIYLCNGSPPKNGKPDKIFLVVDRWWKETECITTSDGVHLRKTEVEVTKEEKLVYDLEKDFGKFEEICNHIKSSGLVDTEYIESVIKHNYKVVDKSYFAYYTKPHVPLIIRSLQNIHDKWIKDHKNSD